MSSTLIREVATVGLTQEQDGNTYADVTIITPGEGSSGLYEADVLEAAARNKVFAAGTQMFLDHADEQKANDYPVGRVGDLAAALVEDAHWDGTALKARAEIFEDHAAMLKSKQRHIGVSIRANGDFVPREAGQTPKITALTEAISVDFVTRAGRGGAFIAEAARTTAIATNDSALKALEQAPAPAGQPQVNESEENAMAEISLPEEEVKKLRESAAREADVTAERDRLLQEAEAGKQAARDALGKANSEAAKRIVAEAFNGVDAPKITERLARTFPVGDDGSIDEAAFKADVEEAAAELAEAAGAGRIRDFGTSNANENELGVADLRGLGITVKED